MIAKQKLEDKEKEEKAAAQKAIEDKKKSQDKAGDGNLPHSFHDSASNPEYLKSGQYKLPGLIGINGSR